MQPFIIFLVFLTTILGFIGFGKMLGSRHSSKDEFYYIVGVIGFIGTVVGYISLVIFMN